MTCYKLPIIRFAPSKLMVDRYNNDSTSFCDIKHYQIINNSVNDNLRIKDTTTVVEFVQEYLQRLNVKRSDFDIPTTTTTTTDIYKKYDIVIKFQLFDKRQDTRHQINVKIKLVSMIDKNLDLINLFEDIIIYNFYHFNHDTMMTKIIDLVMGLEQ